MAFMDNVVALCVERGITLSELAKSIGMYASATTGWKRGADIRPTTKKKIADYFGVTVAQMMAADGINAQKEKPSDEIGELLSDLRNIMDTLSPEARQRLIEHARLLALAEQGKAK